MNQLKLQFIETLSSPIIATIILPIIAIAIAIWIPSSIAKKQNRIAVFDKLYYAYSQLHLVKSFSVSLIEFNFNKEKRNPIILRDLIKFSFEMNFNCNIDFSDFQENIGKAISILRKNEMQTNMIPLLISKNEKQKDLCSEKLLAIYEPLFVAITLIIELSPANIEETEKYLNKFIKNVEDFFNTYGDTIEKALLCNQKRTFRPHLKFRN